jgi:hypothetical protein
MQATAEILGHDAALDVTPMTHLDKRDGVWPLIEGVAAAIIPFTDAPPGTSRQGQTSRRAWMGR